MPEKAETDKSKAPEKSRLQRLIDKNERYVPSMPPIDCGAHVLEYLWAVGPSLSGGMGDGPLTYAELRAYQDNTGIELTEWEVSTLRRLSIDHINESGRATKRDCKAPWQGDAQVQVLAVADGRDAIRALAKL